MIRHAMAYVQMAQRIRAELSERHPAQGALLEAEHALLEAERALVRAYSEWRGAMEMASAGFVPYGQRRMLGSRRAEKYLRRTTWDLT